MAERFPDFQVEEIQELKENSENQNTKKNTSTWLNIWTSWAESAICKLLKSNSERLSLRQTFENSNFD